MVHVNEEGDRGVYEVRDVERLERFYLSRVVSQSHREVPIL